MESKLTWGGSQNRRWIEKKIKISRGGERKDSLGIFHRVTRQVGGHAEKSRYMTQLFQGDARS